jgi:hypothetical protein
MITSEIDICNMALDFCNCRNITSLEEGTKESKKCSAWYDIVRKSLLTNLNASFAIKRAKLVEDANYIEVFGYKKAYSLPRDVLQVLNVNDPLGDELYQVEADNRLYCNDDIKDVYIRYLADIKDVTKFDSDFDLISGRYVIDAKSIMGIFSLDLSKPITLNIHSTNDVEKILETLKPYTEE